MTDLTWPGDERAGDLCSDRALLRAMVATESAWLAALADSGLAPRDAAVDLAGLVTDDDVTAIAAGAEASGHPVVGLVDLLRKRLAPHPVAARWIHRGLTGQDVLDTALVLTSRDALDRVATELDSQARSLSALATRHRDDPCVARTLTQHAVPTTIGLTVASWLTGVLDAADDVDRVRAAAPGQAGGAAGTWSAVVEMAAGSGARDPVGAAAATVERCCASLRLAAPPPWHTSRAPITRIGDVLVGCTDAWGRVANDVLVRCRPEIGEVREAAAAGRGASSTMPQKQNPVLSILVRRAALGGPALASTLHLAAATSVDQRPDGAWHAEWSALRDLGRRTVVAGAQASELVEGLRVDVDRAGRNLAEAADVRAEQSAVAELVGHEATGPYLGAARHLVDRIVDRARPRIGAPS